MGLARWQVKKAATGHQKWSGYEDSPELSSDYPYQCIYGTSDTRLFMSKYPIEIDFDTINYYHKDDSCRYTREFGGTKWVNKQGPGIFFGITGATPHESNTNIVVNPSEATWISKTTTPDQDRPIITSLVRV